MLVEIDRWMSFLKRLLKSLEVVKNQVIPELPLQVLKIYEPAKAKIKTVSYAAFIHLKILIPDLQIFNDFPQ